MFCFLLHSAYSFLNNSLHAVGIIILANVTTELKYGRVSSLGFLMHSIREKKQLKFAELMGLLSQVYELW